MISKAWMMTSLMAAAIMVGSSGCEWSSGGGASSWNSAYNWVNFSGTYRGIGGGRLVTDYSTTPGGGSTTNNVSGQGFGSTAQNQVNYGGWMNQNIIPGTVQITIGGVVFTDSGGNGSLTSGLGGSGAVSYSSGRWDVNLGGIVVAPGQPISGSYTYVVRDSSGSTGAGSGASGASIYSFVVWQNGEVLQITDNNGRVYEGQMGSVNGTLNATDGSAPNPGIGESVVAQFSAQGISAANYEVTIAGTFQGVVGGTEENKYLSNRQLFGTWIEKGGRTGDINGEASPLLITSSGGGSSSSSTEATATTTTP